MPNLRRDPNERELPQGIVTAIEQQIKGDVDIAFVIAVEYNGQPHVFGYDDADPGGGPATVTSVYSCTLVSEGGSTCIWYVDSSGNWRKRCI